MTEAVFLALPETEDGTVAAEALVADPGSARTRPRARDRARVSRRNEETGGLRPRRSCARARCPSSSTPTALNAFAGRAADLADRKADAVLTPHEGEFGRLTGDRARELDADRLAPRVRRLAADADAVTLLKGSRTLVVDARRAVRINPTGGPVLATAGSGDVLTGVIGGLLARGSLPVDAAARRRVPARGAGWLAGREHGEGTLAGDLVAHAAARPSPAVVGP